MKNSELVENQIIGNKPLGEKFINDINTSTHFTSGRKIEVGDKLLIAFIENKLDEITTDISMIKFHQEEYGIIYEDAFEEAISSDYPTLKLKSGYDITNDK
jgi:hypothetical protein